MAEGTQSLHQIAEVQPWLIKRPRADLLMGKRETRPKVKPELSPATSSEHRTNLPLGPWLDFAAYQRDVWERSILYLDALRQRADDLLAHDRAGKPPVLDFDYELILDARRFEKPANYALLRITRAGDDCLEDCLDSSKPPVMVVDPRAGHGPGIGGFKRESEVGIALQLGHPVYFVVFYPEPCPGQTLANVLHALRCFVKEVTRRHSGSLPILYGNCQAGWAITLLAADCKGLVGPIVLNGSPLSYWAGDFGVNPIKVTFADVAGVDEAKQELAEVVGFLKDPQTYGRLGARIPKGVLLVGPPGTGKTLLARAVAGEAGVRFFSITGSEFVEMFVGVGAARVRDLFEQARAQAPAIVFIDELDALGRARGIDFPGAGHDEKEQTLNQLLAEMDGFDPTAGIIVLAATNRPEVLDPALLRAGRFDRQILVDRPDRKGRADILRVHLSKVSTAADLDVDAVAALTPGFTGADLANLVNEAALVASRRGADATTLDDFTQAVERIVAGLEKKSRILSPREREVVAHHEMGHALVAMALPGTDPVQKVSIIPRGIAALGYTMQRPTEDRFLMSRSELTNRMAVLLGGRAAESLVFDEVSTGAADDLVRATDIARNMVVRFGMSTELGQVAYEPETGSFLVGQTPMWRPRTYGDGTAEAIDHEVKDLIDRAFKTARAILERNQSILDASAKELLTRETLGPEELAKLTAGLTRDAATKRTLAAV